MDETTMRQQDLNQSGRGCGWDEDAALFYVDGDLAPAERSRFESHLAGCALCRHDVTAWESLYRGLAGLIQPAAAPTFTATVLAALLPPAPPAVGGRVGRRPLLRPVAVGALVSVSLAVLWLLCGWVLGPAVVDRTPGPVAHFGVRTLLDGVSQILAAVKVSESLIAVIRTLEPIVRSAAAVGRSVQTEFWMISLLLALMTFWGAVRLALGRPVMERGVRRVHFAL